ncbi:MAG: ABC transporter ATP-binding protein [Erysipelotrichaceae bacterium]|nr:ABC transporter ATP-binding protein [Erysipelotrichaceae bacterium]
METILSLSGVTKNYKTAEGNLDVLKGVNLHVEKGEWIAVCGPSGSGKSTLLQLLSAEDSDYEGQIQIFGMNMSELSSDQKAKFRLDHIAYIHQDFELIPFLTVRENIVVKDLIANRRTNRKRVISVAGSLGITEKLKSFPNEISGGQKQRTAVARALYSTAELVLADEPTGNLPASSRDAVMEQFSILHQNNKTIICVTHDPKVAACAQKVYFLENGRLSLVDLLNRKETFI